MIIQDIDPFEPFIPDSQLIKQEAYYHANPACISFNSEWMTAYPGAKWLPKTATVLCPTTEPFSKLAIIMDILLGPHGCPWDREQSHRSLVKHLIEETYEATEAIEQDDWNALAEELGDVLLQPVFHMRLAERDNEFEFNEPLKRITDKLVRRHPHVFATTEVTGSDEVLKNWDAIKKQEKKLETSDAVSILSGVPTSLPSLARAMEISKRAARAGFEWPDIEGVKDKVLEELNEFEHAVSQQEKEAEFGDLLFTLVNFARWQKIDAEAALRQMVLRFQKRFEQMELSSSKPLNGLSPEEWDQLWSEAKNKSQNES